MNEPMKPMPRLAEVIEDLQRREPLFHRPESGAGPADAESITDETFWEIGASGQIYRREQVLDILRDRLPHALDERWQTSHFECHPLAPGLYLFSYTLKQEERETRRTTLWHRTVDGWKAMFHQGTVVLKH